MQHFASMYLAKNYKLPQVVTREGYCPCCLRNGKGKIHSLTRQWSSAGSGPLTPLTKEDIWRELFEEEGVDPVQALRFFYLNTLKPKPINHSYFNIYNFKEPGRKCPNTFICHDSCALCFTHISSSPSVSIQEFPEFKFHKFCCQKCSSPHCEEMVPSLPPTWTKSSERAKPHQKTPHELMPTENFCMKHREIKESALPVMTKVIPLEKKENVVKVTPVEASGRASAKKATSLRSWLKGGLTSSSSVSKPVAFKNSKNSSFKSTATAWKGKKYDDPDAPSAASPLPVSLIPRARKGAPRRFDFSAPEETASGASSGPPEQED